MREVAQVSEVWLSRGEVGSRFGGFWFWSMLFPGLGSCSVLGAGEGRAGWEVCIEEGNCLTWAFATRGEFEKDVVRSWKSVGERETDE